jgi:hypothetical protein
MKRIRGGQRPKLLAVLKMVTAQQPGPWAAPRELRILAVLHVFEMLIAEPSFFSLPREAAFRSHNGLRCAKVQGHHRIATPGTYNDRTLFRLRIVSPWRPQKIRPAKLPVFWSPASALLIVRLPQGLKNAVRRETNH